MQMIHILFFVMLFCGLVHEICDILGTCNELPLRISIIYLLTEIFFLFWTEPFIDYRMIVVLILLRAINVSLMTRPAVQQVYGRLYPYLAMSALVSLALHYLGY